MATVCDKMRKTVLSVRGAGFRDLELHAFFKEDSSIVIYSRNEGPVFVRGANFSNEVNLEFCEKYLQVISKLIIKKKTVHSVPRATWKGPG